MVEESVDSVDSRARTAETARAEKQRERDESRESGQPGQSGRQDGARVTPKRWFLLLGDRFAIAGALVAGVLALFVLVDVVAGVASYGRGQPLFYLFGGLVAGNFTLVTIVVSINQLVISRQIGSPGELREQIEATNAYRDRVEESTDVAVAPVTPTEFLYQLLRSTEAALDDVDAEARRVHDGEARDELLEVVDELYFHVDHVKELLSRPEVGVFETLAAALRADYSEEIYRLRQVRSDRGDVYPDSIVERLDELVVRLQQIDVARQYLKTLYVQDELSRLSRVLLYVGVPAVLVSALTLRMLSAPADAAVPPEAILPYLSLAIAVAVSPLAILLSYVLRFSTVAEHTVAITPFTTGEREHI